MKDKQANKNPSDKAQVEVLERAKRRQFSASYKLKIVQEADNLSGTGKIGSLLRREGLYASQLAKWRKLRDTGALSGLSKKKRGPKATKQNPLADELETMRRENKRLLRKLHKAELLIDLQKKVAALLSEDLMDEDEGSA